MWTSITSAHWKGKERGLDGLQFMTTHKQTHRFCVTVSGEPQFHNGAQIRDTPGRGTQQTSTSDASLATTLAQCLPGACGSQLPAAHPGELRLLCLPHYLLAFLLRAITFISLSHNYLILKGVNPAFIRPW